jgi:hypothetical protein
MRDYPLRTFDLGELLDAAFTLYRQQFTGLFAIAFLANLPLIVFWLLAPLFLAPGAASNVMAELGSLITMPYNLAATMLVLGALTTASWAAYQGEEIEIGDSLLNGLRRIVPVAVAVVVSWGLIFLGLLLLIVPGLLLLAGFFAVLPAAVIEERGPFAAIGRSRALAKGGRARILLALLLTYLITILPIFAVSMVAGVWMASGLFSGVSTEAFQGSWAFGLVQAVTLTISALTYPFFALVTVLLYVDRRARAEAPDLEEAVARLARQA